MDTPGYGFNSVKEWGEEIEKYLRRRKMLKGVVLLLRADVGLSKWDVDVLSWLGEFGTRTVVVFTRADRCEGAWDQVCLERYGQVRELLGRKQEWVVPEIYVTAAGMRDAGGFAKGKNVASQRDEAGLVGARIALLRLAGLVEEEKKEETEPKAEAWRGKTVSFDDIPLKGGLSGQGKG
jgi:GTP-binding protein